MIDLKFSSHDYLFFLSTSKEIVGINRKLDQTENINSLLFIDYQKNELIKNTTSFLNNQKFNNVFLWGEKGMGKSTLVRSVINFVKKNLLIHSNYFDLISFINFYILYKLLCGSA